MKAVADIYLLIQSRLVKLGKAKSFEELSIQCQIFSNDVAGLPNYTDTLANELQMPHSSVQRHLNNMVQQGVISRVREKRRYRYHFGDDFSRWSLSSYRERRYLDSMISELIDKIKEI